MTIRYKLTDKSGMTHNNTEWGPGRSYITNGKGQLCGPGWLHCYNDPLVAIFMNPHHGNFDPTTLKMCEVQCSGQYKDDNGLKEGWTSMAFVQWIPTPEVTETNQIAFAILCAKQVCPNTLVAWHEWANNWLSGKDCSTAEAAKAVNAAIAYFAAAYSAAAAASEVAASEAAAYAATAYAAAAYAALNLPEIARQAMEYN